MERSAMAAEPAAPSCEGCTDFPRLWIKMLTGLSRRSMWHQLNATGAKALEAAQRQGGDARQRLEQMWAAPTWVWRRRWARYTKGPSPAQPRLLEVLQATPAALARVRSCLEGGTGLFGEGEPTEAQQEARAHDWWFGELEELAETQAAAAEEDGSSEEEERSPPTPVRVWAAKGVDPRGLRGGAAGAEEAARGDAAADLMQQRSTLREGPSSWARLGAGLMAEEALNTRYSLHFFHVVRTG